MFIYGIYLFFVSDRFSDVVQVAISKLP